METLEQQADRAAGRGDHQTARRLLEEAAWGDGMSFDLWLKISVMRRATGDAAMALRGLDRALAIRPLDFSALLMRASILDALGEPDASGEAYGRALAQAPDRIPPGLARIMEIAQARYRNWQHGKVGALRDAVTSSGAVLTDALDAMILASVRLTPPERDGPTHYCMPGLPVTGFYANDLFPWLRPMEQATATIAAEFAAADASLSAEHVPYIQYPDSAPLDQWQTLNRSRDWTAIHLIDHGRVIEGNTQHCPQTMTLLAGLPLLQISGAEPNAMFSLLAPRTHIPPHTGIANFRLVCHIPLIVPMGCWFRVGNDRRAWEVGKAWVFDDTIEHEAMNPTGFQRVVLIVDIWHPDLTDNERTGIAAIVGAGGKLHGL